MILTCVILYPRNLKLWVSCVSIPSVSLKLSNCLNKVVPKNLKGKSKSSQEWLTRQLNDEYVKRSRYDNYRCRSAYKLLEIDDKYKILKPGYSVVDCGAAPGSWTQVAVQKVQTNQQHKAQACSVVVAVDLQCISALKGAIILQESNFLHLDVQQEILTHLANGKADVILSDMAPDATGVHDIDSVSIMNLAYGVLRFAIQTLKEDGTFLCKVWNNENISKMVKTLELLFSNVNCVKPKASRLDSAELYLLGRGFKNVK